jgi:hypothetical protein
MVGLRSPRTMERAAWPTPTGSCEAHAGENFAAKSSSSVRYPCIVKADRMSGART